MTQEKSFKTKDLQAGGGSAFKKYKAVTYGDVSMGAFIRNELLVLLLSDVPGALGLFLRSKLYRGMFGRIGHKVVFGRNVTLRHPHKIKLGDGVIVDDNAVLDAKGESNQGLTIGNNVYIGRNSIIYCKNGDIVLEDNVNLSSNCQVFSSNKLTIKRDTMIGAYSYFLSGGTYDINDRETPFSKQTGMLTKGELIIGANCWFGARVTVVDGASIGDHCVIGAGAVVTKPIPADSLAAGVPAKVMKSI